MKPRFYGNFVDGCYVSNKATLEHLPTWEKKIKEKKLWDVHMTKQNHYPWATMHVASIIFIF